MFGFWNKKKVNTQGVKAFDEALGAIKIFIQLSEWEEAKAAIREIRSKEKISFDILIEELSKNNDTALKQREKQEKLYEKRCKKLEILSLTLKQKEESFHEKELKERFAIRFKKIASEILIMTAKYNNIDALNILQRFLEENKERPDVIKFYNKQKKNIQKNIRKEKLREDMEMKKNAKLEALKLIGQNVGIEKQKAEKKEEYIKKGFLSQLKEKLNLRSKIKEAIKRKNLEHEIKLLIEEDSKVEQEVAERKLENIHKWLIKEISHNNIEWYDLYGKILGADKISGDTFGFYDYKEKYNFFLWDATGHGIRAGFIVTLLSRLVNQHAKQNPLRELAFEINNGLKQDLKSRNFITWIFFEISKKDINELHYVGMGHEPMLVYKAKSKTVQRLIPGWLAAGIRMIQKVEDIKVKTIELEDGDIILTYSDGIIESKNIDGEFYWLGSLEENFLKIAQIENDIEKIYGYVMKQLQIFRWGSQFDDDTSVLIFRRNHDKDKLAKESEFLKELSLKEGLKKKDVRKLEWKSKLEVQKALWGIKKEKEMKRIVKILDNLYITGEILKLKQESIRYIKDWYISKEINRYLKKARDNEQRYKIEQKEQKVNSKYTLLSALYKKWDYTSVINEVEDIIARDGNI